MEFETDLQPPFLPPGFRFHPTDEELIEFYLRKRAAGEPCPVPVIAEVDIYKFNPWELPHMAKQQHQLQGEDMFGCSEWYFFTPRERKYPNGVRPNRAAGSGYWKATGTDRPIVATSATATGGGEGRRIGVKKALVFYKGKPPMGSKTNWIMHEFRLTDQQKPSQFFHMMLPVMNKESISMRLDDWVLCRIYEKTHNQQQQSPGTSTDDQRIPEAIDDSHNLSGLQQEPSTYPGRTSTSSTPNSGSLSNILCGVDATDYSMLSGQLFFTANNSQMNPPSDLHQQPPRSSFTNIQSPANITTAINPASLSAGFCNSGDNIDSSGVNPLVVQPILGHHQWASSPNNPPALEGMMTTGGRLIGLKRPRESADRFDFRHVHSFDVNGLHPTKNDPTDPSRNFTNTSSTAAGSTSSRFPVGYGNLVGTATQFGSMDQLGPHDMLPNPNFLGFQ